MTMEKINLAIRCFDMAAPAAFPIVLCIPPALREEAERLVSEQPPVHPAWSKVQQRGKHYSLRTSSIEDLEELADWAYSWLTEPSKPLNKPQRQAFQTVISRACRHVHLRKLGGSHYQAVAWKASASC